MKYIIVGKNGRNNIISVVQSMTQQCLLLTIKKYRNGNIRWFSWYQNRWVKYKPININPHFDFNDIIILWGFYYQTPFNGAIVYNNTRSIQKISNKYLCRMELLNNEIPVPHSSKPQTYSYNYPCIIRPFHHRGGRDFYIIDNLEELNSFIRTHSTEYYASELYNKTVEYRVHVTHGKILYVAQKKLSPDSIQANRDITGENWDVVPWGNYNKNVCKIAIDAVKCMDNDTGGVDVMCNPELDVPCVICEINSAPGIAGEYSIKRYSMYFDWLFRQQRKWYDYTQWNKGSSFAFKNFQLGE